MYFTLIDSLHLHIEFVGIIRLIAKTACRTLIRISDPMYLLLWDQNQYWNWSAATRKLEVMAKVRLEPNSSAYHLASVPTLTPESLRSFTYQNLCFWGATRHSEMLQLVPKLK